MSIFKRCVIAGCCILSIVRIPVPAQVKPNEIANPKLKTDEAEFLPQMESLQRSIEEYPFAYPLQLCSCTEAKDAQKAYAKDRGIELVYFKDSELMKISGIYKASYSTKFLSKNERAAHTLQQVVVPILKMTLQQFSKNRPGDGVGVEIVYNARDHNHAYDFEGKEVIATIFSWPDAFAYMQSQSDLARQDILNRSEIYVNGEAYGIALSQRNAFPVNTLERSVPRRLRHSQDLASGAFPATTLAAHSITSSSKTEYPAVAGGNAIMKPASMITAEDKQAQFNKALNRALIANQVALHLAPSNPSSFEDEDGQVALHMNLLNPLSYGNGGASIYKQSAEGFDLVIAPELKKVFALVPSGARYDLLHFTLLAGNTASEKGQKTIDYICPRDSAMLLARNMISSQDLINQCAVIVNSVRIRVNLQLVE